MKILNILAIAALSVTMSSCCSNPKTQSETACQHDGACNKCEKMEKYSKKYTNADFYTDGKFNEDVAIEAMKDMIKFYDLPFTEFLEANFWVAEFGLGDFENVGMGGVFWVNDKEHGYFAHAIYLLPGQMIPEHCHLPTDMPAKHEVWMVEKGWAYNFSEIGEATPNAPEVPAAHGPVVSKNFKVQEVGDIIPLAKLESWHFLMAGPEGAIIDEWASYHDGDGLRFTNKSAAL